MKVKGESYDVGVILGRFQVDELHEAHRELFDTVLANHERVLCFIGLNGSGQPTKENPLDYEARKQMIEEAYPGIICGFIKDVGNDPDWSRNFDGLVATLLHPNETVCLYGGRGSFIKRYTGKYPTRELEPEKWISASGTERRRKISKKVKASKLFRQGVIWAMSNRFPVPYPCVDIAIIDDHGRVVLGQRANEPAWRFVGGFVDVGDPSFEAAAQREAQEETTVVVGQPEYLGNFKIDDWRYRYEVDKIFTTFYVAHIESGDPRPDDDLAGGFVKPFEIGTLTPEDIMPTHHVLLECLQNDYNNNPTRYKR